MDTSKVTQPCDVKAATVLDMLPVPKIDYVPMSVSDISMAIEHGQSGSKEIVDFKLAGEKMYYTSRFGQSLGSIFGFSESIFKFFDPSEVVERITERGFGDAIRVAIQENVDGSKTALAAAKPNKSFVRADDLLFELMERSTGKSNIQYAAGVVTSMHKPSRMGDSVFQIGGSDMLNRFVVETPIDGFGLPAAYISLLRQVCSNGMIGYAKAFKSQIQLGNAPTFAAGKIISDAIPTFRRFLDSYNNEEGYSIIRSRLEAAHSSPASLDEFYGIYSLLNRGDMRSLHGDTKEVDKGYIQSPLNSKMVELVGDVQKLYGIVSLDQMATKSRRRVPVGCTVADLINLATEVGTHKANTEQSRKIQGWVGTMLSNAGGYDLEGTIKEGETPKDLFITSHEDAHKDDNEKV